MKQMKSDNNEEDEFYTLILATEVALANSLISHDRTHFFVPHANYKNQCLAKIKLVLNSNTLLV